jgi:hypothetical protein
MGVRPIRRLSVSPLALCAGILLGAAVVTLGFSLRWPMVNDAPILNYIGWRITQGDVPYRDMFDVNMPGAYLFHALVALLPFDWDLSTAVANVVAVGIAAGLCWILAARVSGRVAGAFAAALCIILCLSQSAWGVIQRDFIMTIPVLGALVIGTAPGTTRLRHEWIAGVCFGLASTIKPQTLVIAVAYWSAVFLHRSHRLEAGPRVVIRFVVMGSGIIAAWIPILVWLGSTGGLTEFLGTILPFNARIYSQFNASVILDSRAGLFDTLVLPDLLKATGDRVLRLVVIAAAAYYVFFDRTSFVRLATSLAAVAGAALFFLQLKGWPYHLFPGLILGSAVLGDLLGDRGQGTQRSTFLLKAVIIGATMLTLYWAVHWLRPSVLDSELKIVRTRKVVDTLRPLVQAGQTVQIFDTAEGGLDVLLRLGLKLPTSMVYDFPLYLPMLGSSFDVEPAGRVRQRFVTELVQARPDYLLVYRYGFPRGGYERLDSIDALGRFVRDTYEIVADEPTYRILRRRDARAGLQ